MKAEVSVMSDRLSFDDKIRQAYAGRTASTSCISEEELPLFYNGQLQQLRNEEIRRHLASCRNCLEMAEDYCQFAEVPLIDEPRRPAERFRSIFMQPAFQIAAVLLLLVTVSTVWITTRHPAEQTTLRGTTTNPAPRPVSPSGTLGQTPQYLEWQPLEGTDHYEVEIRDPQLNAIWQQSEIRETRVELPSDVIRVLRPGVEYGWRVTAIDRNGRQTDSDFHTFRFQER
jgi:hypothetical protein